MTVMHSEEGGVTAWFLKDFLDCVCCMTPKMIVNGVFVRM